MEHNKHKTNVILLIFVFGNLCLFNKTSKYKKQ